MWILLITVTNLLLIPLYLPLESGCLCLRYFDDFTNLSHKQNFVSFYVLFIQSFISFKFLIKTRSQHVENAKTQSIKALLEYKGRVRKNCLWERVLSVFYISEFLSPFMQTFMLLT